MRFFVTFLLAFAYGNGALFWLVGATLTWSPNPIHEGVTNYTVHSGPASRTYVTNWRVGNVTSAVIPSNAPAFYAITAENEDGVSGYSAELFFVPMPAASHATLRLLSTTNVSGPWREFAAIPITATNGAEFFRLAVTLTLPPRTGEPTPPAPESPPVTRPPSLP